MRAWAILTRPLPVPIGVVRVVCWLLLPLASIGYAWLVLA
jgi:hypothetical protein